MVDIEGDWTKDVTEQTHVAQAAGGIQENRVPVSSTAVWPARAGAAAEAAAQMGAPPCSPRAVTG